MGLFDSVTLVLILFGIAMLGWLAEFYLYVASDLADGLTTNQSIIGIKDTLTFFVQFIHSNFFSLAVALSLTNLVVGSRTTLNPVWAGIFTVAMLLLFWLLDLYIIPVLFDTLVAFETGLYPTSMNWSELFMSNWYIVALSGVLGTLIGYVRGVRNEMDVYVNLKGRRRWR